MRGIFEAPPEHARLRPNVDSLAVQLARGGEEQPLRLLLRSSPLSSSDPQGIRQARLL